jgi:hypothetical protein
MARGGISTSSRYEGADTEWVLDVSVPIANMKTQTTTHGNGTYQEINGLKASTSRFGALADWQEDNMDNISEEDDIWDTTQSSGRQTFGSFKKRRSRAPPEENENDQDLSSGSDSEEGSESGDDFESGSPSESYRNHKPKRHRDTQSTPAKENMDSDEEMRQVRRAIQQKHQNLRSGSSQQGARGGKGTPAAGGRNKVQGSRVMKSRGDLKKRSRKTI